jgi:hypothetical protein
MEEDIEPTAEQITAEPLLQLFRYKHLRDETLRGISRKFCALALATALLPRNQERSAALRFLRQAKDCAVTAQLWQA